MTVGEIAAICGIPSAVTVAIVGFFFVWLLERSIVKRETARAAERGAKSPRKKEEAKLGAERVKTGKLAKKFLRKTCLRVQTPRLP